MKILRSRLGLRLFALLLLGVLLSFGILTYLIVEREKSVLTDFHLEKSSLLAESITTNLIEAMLDKDPALVRRMVDRHNGSHDDVAVAVFRNNGELYFGKTDYQIPAGILSSPKQTHLRTKDGLIFLEPLQNEQACHGCHNSVDNLRGIVGVKISTSKAAKEISETAKRMAAFAFAIAVLSGAGLIVVLRKMVLKPLTTLKAGTEKIGEGDLSHRIDLGSGDEFGALALAFNGMTERVENVHRHLEDAVRRKTKELSVITELSMKVFSGDLTLGEIIDRFLHSIKDELGYSFCTVCLVDKETGLIQQEFRKGFGGPLCASNVTLSDSHPFAAILRETRPVIKKASEIGIPHLSGNLAIIPIISHQKKRCRNINLCNFSDCPAFNSADERCWLIEGTLCRSPQAVKGKDKIYGCLHCDVFPLIGALIAGSSREIEKSSFHSLEILTSEIAAAVENYRLIDEKKRDIKELIRLHDVSVESLKYLNMSELTKSIVISAVSFARADASILWLLEGERLTYRDSFGIDDRFLPRLLTVEGSFAGRSITEGRAIETISMREPECLKDIIDDHGFAYAASIPLRLENTTNGCLIILKKNDFFMTDSEKAIISLYASQAGSAINTADIYGDLKQEMEFSDAIFNCAVSGVLVLDTKGVVIKINRAGAEILQVAPEALVGKKITDSYPALTNMLSVDRTLDKEVDLILQDGTVKPVGFTNSLMLDNNGVEEGIIIVFRDLTEIKGLQAGIRKKQHFEAMGKVISGVAHEIRNPLFGIQAIAQLLEREIESEQHQALIAALLKESRRVRNLIDELLLYSRPSNLNLMDLDLEILLAELKEHFRIKDDKAIISISVPPHAIVKADKDKMMQVLLNLVDNSLGAGGKRIDINAERKDSALLLAVSDNGIGIKSDDLDRIFDPFFTTKKNGTGLGLPICRKIIEEHEGTIEVKSAVEDGTTVLITLPSGR